jgi:HEAT repeat protein
MSSDDSWWLWWEYNKADFLRPRRLDLMSAPASGDDAQQALGRFADSMRAVLGKTFDEASKDGDAGVRAAAAIAYGRTAGATAVPRLVELLADANMQVREGAILALGASGADAAVEPLLAIARTGGIDEQQRTRISPTAEAHAIVALGLGRRLGFPERVDRELAERIQKRSKPEREPLGCAAMIYQRLAPCAEFEELAFQLAADNSEAPSVRCRAVEALASAKAPDALSKLQGFLSGPRLDLRRSAALALGEHADPLALAPLMTAFELESESLTRGFILTSIGRRGGPEAREFLLRALEGHPKSMHSWSALALGMLARKSHDAELSKIVLAASLKESNRQAQSAYWIAAGLIGADEALPHLSESLSAAADPGSRMYAASALALLGSEGARAALHVRLPAESTPQVRAAIAQSLGCFGNGQDLDLITGELNSLNEPELQALTATALAFHASFDSMRRLGEIAMRKDGPSLRRAAAIEGVGMILGRSLPLSLMDVSRQANYTVFNEWMDGLYQTTL